MVLALLLLIGVALGAGGTAWYRFRRKLPLSRRHFALGAAAGALVTLAAVAILSGQTPWYSLGEVYYRLGKHGDGSLLGN